MPRFRAEKAKIFGLFMVLCLLCTHASANPPSTKAFVGLGPLFSSNAVGYFNAGADYGLANFGDFSISAGPWLGLLFAKGIFGGDIDGMLKGYYHFQLPHQLSLGISAKFPVGLALLGFTPAFANSMHFAVGFNIGFLPGVEFHFHKNFGIFAEIGFFHHSYFPTADYLKAFHEPRGLFSAGALFKF